MSDRLGRQDRVRAQPIGQIARRIVREKEFYQKGRYSALRKAWTDLVGDALAGRTRICSFGEGELVIEVDSSALLHELNGFMKEELLRELQCTKAGRDIASLRFCLHGRT